MRLLLDTHAAIWAFAAPDELQPAARAALEDPASVVLVSAASVWEIAIKRQLGKLELGGDVGELIDRHRFDRLPISIEHAAEVETLPPHHRDPVDRMLVAQAVVEGATLVTRDRALELYGVPLLRC